MTTTPDLTNQQTVVRRGDLAPDLQYFAYDAAHTADLTNVVSWRLIGVDTSGALVFDDTVPPARVTVDPTTLWLATLTHPWATAETATARRIVVEAEATWPGGKPQTFPRITVDIERDLG